MPKIVDKGKKRSEILDAALRVFSEVGVANARMSRIAEKAGVGKGTIYEYFGSKEEIFGEAFDAFMNRMESVIARAMYRLTDPVQKLEALFDSQKLLFKSEMAMNIRIMLDFWAAGLHDETSIVQDALRTVYRNYHGVITDLINEGIRTGRMKSVNTDVIASVILGALDGLMLQWIMRINEIDVDQCVDFLKETVMNGLLEDNSE